MKILIAEDDRISAHALSRSMQKAGYNVIMVFDGKSAWKELQKKDPPNLVILDWIMPGMTGVDLCRKLKEKNHNEYLYVMILTARTDKADIITAFDAGADDFLTKPFNKKELVARLRVAERNISLQAQLKHRERTILNANMETQQLLASISSILVGIDEEICVSRWNKSATDVFDISANDVLGKPFFECGIRWDWTKIIKHITFSQKSKTQPRKIDDLPYVRPDGTNGFLDVLINPIVDGSQKHVGFLLLANECTERKLMENQLMQVKKLESIGQLAAGVAHEINTPIQFIGDNTNFLRSAFSDLGVLLDSYEGLLKEANRLDDLDPLTSALETKKNELEMDYLIEEIPSAIEQSIAGIQRVSNIVHAMKEFSHPDSHDKTLIDINSTIESTLTVARNEWKYVANIEPHFQSDLPMVPCYSGELNQVILNILINAAHAISDKMKQTGGDEKGTITIQTSQRSQFVEMRISDNGNGIPKEYQEKIFDPFFTTKEIGKGTGQGLAIAYSVIVQKHAGSIEFETEEGRGTTFIIRLPLDFEHNKQDSDRIDETLSHSENLPSYQ